VDGKNFRLADGVRYIQRRAAEHDGRIVTIAQLILFSTEIGFSDGRRHAAAGFLGSPLLQSRCP